MLNSGAILRVRKDKESLFSEKYGINKTNTIGNELNVFENTFVTNTPDGKVRRYSVYATERVIDCKEPGIYVCIQSGSKYGFDNDFNVFLKDMALYLEDSLFYVIPEDIYRYEITDGTLYFNGPSNFDRWHYDFGEYLIQNYTDSKQLIADYYVEQANEVIIWHEEMIELGEDPKALYYDLEDYETLLHKISNYKNHITTEKFKALEDWLKVQIADYD